MQIIEKIKWYFKIGYVVAFAYNGDNYGEVALVYENKKTGERKEEIL